MKEFLQQYVFHVHILLIVLCWAFMGVFLYEKIKKRFKK